MIRVLLTIVLLMSGISAFAQSADLIARQKKQEKAIVAAKKRGAVTANEYDKLMREQEIIKEAIRNAAADGDWTPRELNGVNGKLERASHRLRRYKTNGEVY